MSDAPPIVGNVLALPIQMEAMRRVLARPFDATDPDALARQRALLLSAIEVARSRLAQVEALLNDAQAQAVTGPLPTAVNQALDRARDKTAALALVCAEQLRTLQAELDRLPVPRPSATD